MNLLADARKCLVLACVFLFLGGFGFVAEIETSLSRYAIEEARNRRRRDSPPAALRFFFGGTSAPAKCDCKDTPSCPVCQACPVGCGDATCPPCWNRCPKVPAADSNPECPPTTPCPKVGGLNSETGEPDSTETTMGPDSESDWKTTTKNPNKKKTKKKTTKRPEMEPEDEEDDDDDEEDDDDEHEDDEHDDDHEDDDDDDWDSRCCTESDLEPEEEESKGDSGEKAWQSKRKKGPRTRVKSKCVKLKGCEKKKCLLEERLDRMMEKLNKKKNKNKNKVPSISTSTTKSPVPSDGPATTTSSDGMTTTSSPTTTTTSGPSSSTTIASGYKTTLTPPSYSSTTRKAGKRRSHVNPKVHQD